MFARQLWVYTCVVSLAAGCDGSEADGGKSSAPEAVATSDASSSSPGEGEGVVDASAVRDAAVGTGMSSDAASRTPSDAGSTAPTTTDAAAQPPFSADSGRDDGDADSGVEAPAATAGCLSGITNYKEKGKFAFKAEKVEAVNMWVPAVPAGCKVPVVHFSNDTATTCSLYQPMLEHLASHGFLTTCYESPNTGQGTQCITALDAAYEKHPELADHKVGLSGHGTGGAAAYVCLQRAEEKWLTSKVYAGHAIEPESEDRGGVSDWKSYYAKIKSPMFQLNGSADMLVSASWVGQSFDALSDGTEAYWYEAQGAPHVPVPNRWGQESALVFFRWKLLGDKQACEYFKAMPMGPDWKLQKAQAEKGC